LNRNLRFGAHRRGRFEREIDPGAQQRLLRAYREPSVPIRVLCERFHLGKARVERMAAAAGLTLRTRGAL
jgi:hypothetical protein